MDTAAPTVTFAPADGTKTGNADVNVVLTFNEPVRKANGDPLDNAAAAAAVSLKKDGSGPDLAVSGRVTVNGGKTVITIDPQNALTPGRYTATLAANAVEDEQGNAVPAASATFTVDTDAPTVTFAPADGTKTGNADVNTCRHADVQRTGAARPTASPMDNGGGRGRGVAEEVTATPAPPTWRSRATVTVGRRQDPAHYHRPGRTR